MKRPLLLVLSTLCISCTGLTLGENEPGSDVWLEAGSIAVDDRTDNVFVLQTVTTETTSSTGKKTKEVTKTLYAAHPDDSGVTFVADCSGLGDLRILFPKDGILLMGENSAGNDQLTLLDPNTFAVKKKVTKTARYHGTRLSPSRRYVAVADNKLSSAPIHVIDTATLESVVIPHDGDWLEAMWLEGSDTLVASIFYDDAVDPYARLMTWSFEQQDPLVVFSSLEEQTARASLDVRVEGVERDMMFSFTWVGVDPADRYAVFPVRADSSYRLLILDLQSGAVRTHDDARGPVGFSPDGTTIVSYRYSADTSDPWLVLINAETLEEESLDLPYDFGPQYFITREGNFVVIAPSLLTEGPLVLYDLDAGKSSTVSGPSVHLSEFVSRTGHGELWMVDGGVYVFDFLDETLNAVSLDWVPKHINILPARDLLVLDDNSASSLVFFDPNVLSVTRKVPLPDGE